MTTVIVGACAGILCTVSFLPQVIKIYRTKSVKDISLLTFCVFTAGVFLWFIYGLLIKDMPVIITNTLIFILALAIVGMKIKYSKTVNREKEEVVR
ncbi:MAG: SemiSWEET transporter [bacterium]